MRKKTREKVYGHRQKKEKIQDNINSDNKQKILVIIDTNFWFKLFGIDRFNDCPNYAKQRQHSEVVSVFNGFVKNRPSDVRFVNTLFLRKELVRALGKAVERAKSTESDDIMNEISSLAGMALASFDAYCDEKFDVNSRKYLDSHPETPLYVDESISNEIFNPDAELFALSEMIGASIILSCDKKHVLSIGKYKNTFTASPEYFEEVLNTVRYKNDRTNVEEYEQQCR